MDETPTETESPEPAVRVVTLSVPGARRAVAGAAQGVRGGLTRAARRLFVREHAILIAAVVLYVAWFAHVTLMFNGGYNFPPFDLAIFDQGLWLLTHFHAPFVTVMGRDLFGDHTSFILLALTPIYRLMPEPQGILVIQTLAIAATAIPICLLGVRWLKSSLMASVFAVAFLLNPAVQQGNLEQFHPEAFQVLIMAWAIYAAVESRAVLLGVMVALALLVKEDAAVLVVPLGLWVWVRRDWRWGVKIVASALVWAVFANFVVIRSLLGTNAFYAGRFPFGGVRGFLSALIRHPATFWAYVRQNGRLFYVWQLVFSTGLFSLICPEFALIALIALLENALSTDSYMQQIIYHYSMPLVPILLIGSMYAVSRLRTLRWRRIGATVVAGSALWSCILWGLAPFSDNPVYPAFTPDSTLSQSMLNVERIVPPSAPVAAWWPLVSHLDHRLQVYVWPTPFSAYDWGLGTTSGERLPVSSQVQYVVLPSPLPSDDDPDVWAKIAPYYKSVYDEGGLAVYRRVR